MCTCVHTGRPELSMESVLRLNRGFTFFQVVGSQQASAALCTKPLQSRVRGMCQIPGLLRGFWDPKCSPHNCAVSVLNS